MSDTPPRCKCGETKNLSLEPSESVLIYGPYPGSMYFGTDDHVTYEYRCRKCERALCKRIERMIKSLA